MRSFQTEIDDPIVEQDILELERKIAQFRDGQIDDEKFRSLRLARGVYGQRQPGVQMIRIKLPYGKVTPDQLDRLAKVTDDYSTGNLHVTTRQDIQIHYVSLDRTPELWSELEKDDITLREACGNVVRNITASATAGVDVHEPFDVTPYAKATFEYLLRQPFGQELGRKLKFAFASSEFDTAYTEIHDAGFVPVVKDGQRGFKVVVGGGLGAQPAVAKPIYDFLPADQILQFLEALVRVFDRYGERARRNKARLKYLIADIGLDRFLELLNEEQIAVKADATPIAYEESEPAAPRTTTIPKVWITDKEKYALWIKANVSKQKQEGFYAVGIKLRLGNTNSKVFRALASIARSFELNDLRLTIDQNILIRFVPEGFLENLFLRLDRIGLAEPGYDSLADITACPGTDTCNLGISNSTGVAVALEEVIRKEYPQYIAERDIKIKISGCMNACGQHTIANIGFHGSSIKRDANVAPALQVLLGGGRTGDQGFDIADKVIKVPSKRAPQILRDLLDDFEEYSEEGEYFNTYYKRRGTEYFYKLLQPLTDTESLVEADFQDWGQTKSFKPEIGIGECAGVTIDLVATLFLESREKAELAEEAIRSGQYADAIYHSYSSLIQSAKALLTADGQRTNSYAQIADAFNEHYVVNGKISVNAESFSELVDRIKRHEPTKEFANDYLHAARDFNSQVEAYRHNERTNNGN